MKLRLYCTCGDSCVGEIKPDAKAENWKRQVWDRLHTGEGHAPCDKQTASKARRKATAALQD